MMKRITYIIFLLLIVACSDKDENLFEEVTLKGGFVEFEEAPNLLHDILGENTIVLSTTIVDPNHNAESYAIAIEKEDGTLTESLNTLTSFPGEIQITRQMVLDALGLTDATELPANVKFIGLVTTPEGTYSGQAPSFDATLNESTGGNTDSSLLAKNPSAMSFSVVMFQLVKPNEETSFFISSDDDDVEEILAQNGEGGVVGVMDIGSSDLELGELSGGQGLMGIGLRFNFVGLPQGATISSASVQFSVDNVGSDPVEMIIYGENSGNAEAFGSDLTNLSGRERTTASVVWNIAAWENNGDRTEAQRTIDFSNIIQEIVNRADWVPGNSISIIMLPYGDTQNTTSTSGGREAETYSGDANAVAELIVSYTN